MRHSDHVRDPAGRRPLRAAVWMLLLLGLAACDGGARTGQLEQRLEEIAQRPGGEIEPLPEFEPYEAFTYSAASMRSPFELPRAAQEGDDAQPPGVVEPDLTREPEPLEAFSINALSMVGSMTVGGRVLGLVRDETGRVHRVTVGDYMGRNHGRVERITAERIELTEIVPAGDGGWVERPRTVEISG